MTRFGLFLAALGATLLTGFVLYGSGRSSHPAGARATDPGAAAHFNAAVLRYRQAHPQRGSSLHHLLRAD